MKQYMLMAVVMAATAIQAQAGDTHPFKAKGLYTETCSCRAPCKCEMFGMLEKGCEGVGAMQLAGGSYDGKDLTGMKAAYAVEPGNWVLVYVQPANEEQRKPAEAFLRAVFSAWGKVEAIKDAKIDIAGENGNYKVSVDDGKIMKYETKVVLGGDKKTAVTHGNIGDPLNQTFKQGLSESAMFKDGNHEFTLEKGRNAYFNDEMNANGDI